MPNPVLYITDGTTEVTLLRGPFGLTDWRPARASLKAGGTWQSSPFVAGRRLVAFRRDNIIDTFTILVEGYTQDELIMACQEADRLLTRAMQYWSTSWQTDPVYLVARGTGETNARYSHIHAYSFPNADNPYAPPFSHGRGTRLAMEDLTLVIEHGPWLEFPPALSGCTAISAEYDYNARTYGRDAADVCVRVEALYGYILKEDGDHIVLEDGSGFLLLEGMPYEVYVANKTNMANLTDIWQWDPGPLWANLIDAIPPTTGLFRGAPGAAVANGAIIYFCIDSTVDDSGPFCSLVFDIDTAATIGGATTLTWQYPNPAWQPLLVRDNTISFQNTFVNSVHWIPPADWDETVNINGTVGYCVRCIVNGVNMTNPSQQNRRIYTITWPRYDVDEEDIGGDIVALVRSTADNQASDGASPDLPFNRMWLGLRSLDRGTDFVMHLNVADEQNPTGITCTTSDAGGFVTDDTAPSGLQSTDTVTNVNALTITWAMDSTIMPDFWGTYHAFVRGKQDSGASGDVLVQIITQSVFGAATTPLWSSYQVPFTTTNDWELVDMGKITLPPIGIASPTFDIFELLVEVTDAVAGSTDVTLYDLVLLPIDEWAGSFSNLATNAEVDEGLFLDVDSISDPKRLITCMNRVSATGNIFTAYQVIANDHALVQANATQRMYHLFALDEVSQPCISCAVWLFTNQQYLNMRGAR